MRRILALLLAMCLWSGCAARRTAPSDFSVPAIPETGPRLPDGYEFVRPEERDEEDCLYGSVSLLTEPTVLVSVYLNEAGGDAWDEAAVAATRDYLRVAADWLEEQTAGYGADLTLYYDDGTGDSGLCHELTVEHTFNGDDEGDDFHLELDELCAGLDTEALQARYGTDRVGFLFFAPSEGASYTLTHYQEDGTYYYHEYCILYRYDAYSDPGTPEGPAVYAHEILHLFGAPDLYEGSADYYVTDELVAYVESVWPDAIMNYTYNPDGSVDLDRIQKILCPLTAYRLGLCDGFAGQEQFPGVDDLPPGVYGTGAQAAPSLPYGGEAVAV